MRALEATRAESLLACVASIVAVGALVVPTAAAHATPALPPALGMGPNLSTSGDYATDVLGDPWDFTNGEDVSTVPASAREHADPGAVPRHRLLGDDRRRPARSTAAHRARCCSWCAAGTSSCRGAATARPSRSTPRCTRCSACRTARRRRLRHPVLKNDAGQAGFMPFNGCQGSPSWDMRQLERGSGRARSSASGIYFAGGGPATLRLDPPAPARTLPPAPPGGVPCHGCSRRTPTVAPTTPPTTATRST